jgi:biotin carboxylase
MFELMTEIDIPAAQSTAVSTIQGALDAAKTIGYPIILRSAFSLGGLGSGFAHDEEELRNLAARSLSLSPQVLIEKSLKGWKEVEYEVVRDAADVRPWSGSADYRTRSFAATWKTLTLSAHILETQLSLPHRRPCLTMSTTCSDPLPSRLSDTSVSLENAT